MSTAQLSLWGGETGGDLHLEMERIGYGLIEHRIPPELIDDLQSAHAIFHDNLPEPEPETLNAMMVDLKDLDKLDFSKDTQKEWHKYRTNTPQFAKPDGYTNRFNQAEALQLAGRQVINKKTGQLETIHEDPKSFFHYTPHLQQRIQNRHEEFGWGPVPPEVSKLCMRMHAVHHIAKQALTSVFRDLEVTYPNLLKKYVTPNDLETSPLRNLLYFKGQGDVLAGGHHDRGIFTMQVGDSHRGLRVRDPQTGEMALVETPPQVSPVFPAHKWRSAYPDSTINSLWHDVINDPTACVDRNLHGRNIARWALIFFVNSKALGEKVNKASTHNE